MTHQTTVNSLTAFATHTQTKAVAQQKTIALFQTQRDRCQEVFNEHSEELLRLDHRKISLLERLVTHIPTLSPRNEERKNLPAPRLMNGGPLSPAAKPDLRSQIQNLEIAITSTQRFEEGTIEQYRWQCGQYLQALSWLKNECEKSSQEILALEEQLTKQTSLSSPPDSPSGSPIVHADDGTAHLETQVAKANLKLLNEAETRKAVQDLTFFYYLQAVRMREEKIEITNITKTNPDIREAAEKALKKITDKQDVKAEALERSLKIIEYGKNTIESKLNQEISRDYSTLLGINTTIGQLENLHGRFFDKLKKRKKSQIPTCYDEFIFARLTFCAAALYFLKERYQECLDRLKPFLENPEARFEAGRQSAKVEGLINQITRIQNSYYKLLQKCRGSF